MTTPLIVPTLDVIDIDPGDKPFAPRSGWGALLVALRPFAIGRFPVTNDEYRLYVIATRRNVLPLGWVDGEPAEGEGDHPVRGVTATDAEAYCRWLANMTDRTIRLPQEAEWEYAAGGPERLRYPWGDRFDPARCTCCEGGAEGSTPVAAHPDAVSPLGCLDMAGNIAEYCADVFRPYDSAEPSGEIDSDGTLSRSLRGGSFRSSREDVRCAARRPGLPEDRPVVGFRICCSA